MIVSCIICKPKINVDPQKIIDGSIPHCPTCKRPLFDILDLPRWQEGAHEEIEAMRQAQAEQAAALEGLFGGFLDDDDPGNPDPDDDEEEYL